MIAMLRPIDKRKTPKGAVTTAVSEEQKEEARARILARLIEHGPITGSWSDIRETLGLGDISKGLFRRSCWHLAKGDRDSAGKPRILVKRDHNYEHSRMYDRPPFRVRAII